MSKPDDIPQDVLIAARAAVAPEYDKFPATHRDILSGGHDDWPIVRVAAHAIMAATAAERDAIAEMVDSFADTADFSAMNVESEDEVIAFRIEGGALRGTASAIRKRGEAK